MKKLVIAAALATSGSVWADSTAEAERILGVWDNQEKTAKIEIFHCAGEDDEYCGKIIELKEPTYPEDDDMAGQTKVDRKNPDESKRKTPILGLQIMNDFEYEEDGVWEEGKIYDPKNGKTYSCKITWVDEKTIEVRGFIGFSLIGRTSTWTR